MNATFHCRQCGNRFAAAAISADCPLCGAAGMELYFEGKNGRTLSTYDLLADLAEKQLEQLEREGQQ